ncbi:MAG TPA: Uma2 family endonuclease [Polyangiaceae bacterium]
MSPVAREVVALTLEQWASLSEEEPGEFVAGFLEEEEVPDLAHESVVAWLIATLKMWLAGRGGFVFGSEVKFAVTPSRGRKSDVSVYFPGRTGLPRRGVVRIPPDVMIEVLSEGRRDAHRDRIDKPDEYAAFGVRWYWLFDPAGRTLEVFELGADGRYVRAFAAASGKLQAPGCDGLVLDLDELWAEVDRLDE